MENQFETSKFQQTLDKSSEIFGKFGQWIGNQRHFSAIRDAFATFIPLLIVGSFAILINSVLIVPDSLLASLCGVEEGTVAYDNWAQASFYLSPIFDGISGATMNFFAVYVAFLFGYFLSKSYGDNELFGGLLAMAVFLVLQPIAADSSLKYLGSAGILLSMFAGLSTPTFYHALNKSGKLKISMPDGVPPAVARSFNALIPLTIVLISYSLIQPVWGAITYSSGLGKQEEITNFFNVAVTFTANGSLTPITETFKVFDGTDAYTIISYGGIIDSTNWNVLLPIITESGDYSDVVISSVSVDNTLLTQTKDVIRPEYYYIFNAVNEILFKPLSNATDSAAMVFIVVMMITLFWFFGVHGPNVMAPFVNAFWTTATIANVDLYSQYGGDVFTDPELYSQLNTWTETTMNAFAFIGGAGATLALILGVLFFSKVQSTKQVSKIATPTGVFQINEPVIFGFPILLNFRWFIPFVFVTPTIAIFIYFITSAGMLNPVVALVPWTAPVFISGLLATLDWRSIIWTALAFAFAFFVYLPFVLLDTKSQLKVVAAEQMELIEEEYKEDELLTKTINLRKEKNNEISKLDIELVNIQNELKEVQNGLMSDTNNQSLNSRKNELISLQSEKNKEIEKVRKEYDKLISKNETLRINFDMMNDKYDNIINVINNNVDEKIENINKDFDKFTSKNEILISEIKERISSKELFINQLNEYIEELNVVKNELEQKDKNEITEKELNNVIEKIEKMNSNYEKEKVKLSSLKSKLEVKENEFNNELPKKQVIKDSKIEKLTKEKDIQVEKYESIREKKTEKLLKIN